MHSLLPGEGCIIKSDIPLTFDLNYRFTDNFHGGIYFSYGFGSVGDPVAQQCTGGSCSTNTLRFGIGGYYPFLGAGLGQYTHVDAPNNGGGDIANKAMHGWFNFGARISFTP